MKVQPDVGEQNITVWLIDWKDTEKCNLAIVTVLSDMDAEIVGLERRQDKTHAIKQGMMQELLTGRTRLV